MINEVISLISSCLPAHSEEGEHVVAITRSTILAEVRNGTGCAEDFAKASVLLVERMLNGIAALDSKALANGQWQFVSFPAQLLAHSLLQVLADGAQSLFADRFWEQGSHRPADAIEMQRSILDWIETQRVLHHRIGDPQPIRHIYVAWAAVKLDGRFLLHHREDRARPKTGNYVLVGGRFNMSDLPPELVPAENLKLVQAPNSDLARKHLARTLMREVEEETGLRHQEHYEFSAWRKLKPYRKVEGARNNRAYTQYEIHVFTLNLHQSGFVRLLDRISASPHELAWFRGEEIAGGQTYDGKRAFIDALLEEFPDHDDLLEALKTIPESYANPYRFGKDTDAIDIPRNPGTKLKRGKTGKENEIGLPLTEAQLGLLWGLGWHGKSLCLTPTEEVRLLPFGWIKAETVELQQAITGLASALANQNYPLVEILDDCYFRLSLRPEYIFFDMEIFNYRVKRCEETLNPELQLRVEKIDTPLGTTYSSEISTQLSEKMHEGIKMIERGTIKNAPDIDSLQRLVQMQIDSITKKAGLRKFIRKDEEFLRISCERF